MQGGAVVNLTTDRTVIRFGPTKESRNRGPEWMLTSFLDLTTREVFVPEACIGFSPWSAAFCTMVDGIPCVRRFGHIFVPASWAREQTSNPEHLQLIDIVVERTLRAAGGAS